MTTTYRKAILSDKYDLEQILVSCKFDISEIMLSSNFSESVNFIMSNVVSKDSIETLYALENESETIGFVQFYGFIPEKQSICIGYIVDKPYQGKGILTSICNDLINKYFSDYRVRTIQTLISNKNRSSIEFCKKMNFELIEEFHDIDSDKTILVFNKTNNTN